MTKRDRQSSQIVAAENNNRLIISPKLLAELKRKGIMAFKQMTRVEQKLVWKWSKELIRQYLSVLEADPSNIRHAESLPFPKEEIKLAIKLSLPVYISKDIQSKVKMLKIAYKEIGAFQAIEPADKGFVRFVSTGKGEVTSLQYRYALRSYDKYMELVVSEKKDLLHEINDFVTKLKVLKKSLKY
jgi:hypothetical protein